MADQLDPEALLRQLWQLLAKRILEVLQQPEGTKAYHLQVARQFLIDNGVTVSKLMQPQDGADQLRALVDQMPDFDLDSPGEGG